MKKLSVSIFLIVLILVIIGGYLFINSDFENELTEKIERKKEIELSDYDLDDNFEIIEVKSDYVSTKDSKDKIILAGKHPQESNIFWDEITIILKNEKDNLFLKKKLEEFVGYEPQIIIKNITGNNKDIFLKAASGGSGGIYFHRVIRYKENDLQIIFNENNNKGIKVVGYFANNFKANLKFKNLNKKVTLDISANKDKYIDQDIYNKKGEMIEVDLIRPYSYPFSSLEVIDYNQDGKYELRGIQKIVGVDGADTISEVESIWSYDENWKIISVNYETYLKK